MMISRFSFSRLKLAHKLMLVGVFFSLLALGSVGLMLWLSWHMEGGVAAVNEAGRLRMQTWYLALQLQRQQQWQLPPTPPSPNNPGVAASGVRPNTAAVAASLREFDDGLQLLAQGDAHRPLFVPWNADTRRAFAQVQQQWQALRSLILAGGTWQEGDAAHFVQTVQGLVRSIEQQMSRWTAWLIVLQMALMLLALLAGCVLMFIAYSYILLPLQRLQHGVQGIAQGQLHTRVEVDVPDEFGELSVGFNRMAATLQELVENLEARVRDKTASLEEHGKRLQAIYDISVLVVEAQEMSVFAGQFAALVCSLLQAQACVVRWGNKDGDLPVLGQAGTPQGAPVVQMPAQIHQRYLGEVHLYLGDGRLLTREERHLLQVMVAQLAAGIESLHADALLRESLVAEERGMLARELHDSIAQSLAFLKIQMQLLREAIKRNQPEVVESVVQELDMGVRESNADVRELLVHFRTRTSSEDINNTLRSTLARFEQQTGVKTVLQGHVRGIPLLPDVQIQVLHILQEALSNIRKHAQASTVAVVVQALPQWRFSVRDDGVGFDLTQLRDASHVGLHIMRERAARIGAQVRIESALGQGCSVTLLLPAGPRVTGLNRAL